MSTVSGSFSVSGVECIDLSKSSLPISTGIGYLDHMIDQLNSHAQVGVAVTVNCDQNDEEKGGEDPSCRKNRYASFNQQQLVSLVGGSLGAKLRPLLQHVPSDATSRFCCPLDEALVECILTKTTTEEEDGQLLQCSLAPYGIYPRPTGRTKIGSLETKSVEAFLQALAQRAGLQVCLRKIRGDNGHHIVESSFKALSRALRNLLDGTDTTTTNKSNDETHKLWGIDSDGYQQGLALQRQGRVERNTKETNISVVLRLDGGPGGSKIHTGLGSLDEFLVILAREAHVTLDISCRGDLWVDDHHTSEDVAIAVGQVLNQAFGTKAGLNRMWCAQGGLDNGEGAQVEVTMDLSNRPCLTHNLTLADSGEEYVDETEADWTVEMVEHVLESLVMNAHMTVHAVELQRGTSVKDTVMATAAAFGRALRFCAAIDPRRAGTTASSKGTLSV